MQLVQEIGKFRRFSFFSVAIAVDGLSQERDFQTTLGSQLVCFFKDLSGRSPLFGAADHWHDAIGAEFVATDLDANIGLKWRRSHLRISKRIETLMAAFDLID